MAQHLGIVSHLGPVAIADPRPVQVPCHPVVEEPPRKIESALAQEFVLPPISTGYKRDMRGVHCSEEPPSMGGRLRDLQEHSLLENAALADSKNRTGSNTEANNNKKACNNIKAWLNVKGENLRTRTTMIAPVISTTDPQGQFLSAPAGTAK